MKYLYWIVALAVVLGGVWLSTLVNPQPASKSVISFSQFETPEDLGRRIASALKSEIKKSNFVLLGVTPNQIEDMEMWRGFFEANQESGMKYDVLAVEPMLPYVELFDSQVRINIRDEMPLFVEGVKKALSQGLRVAVVVPNIYSSQLLLANPAARLQKEFSLLPTSFSIAKFPLTLPQEEFFEPACVLEQGKDPAGTGPLGCMIRKLAKKTYKEKIADGKYSGFVEKLSETDYLILMNRNPASR